MAELSAGARAPRFSLPGLHGGVLSGPVVEGRLTLLSVFKASCPTCRWALPFVQRLHEQTRGGALRVLGIAEDSVADAEAFASELGLDFPIAVEAEPWETSAAYGLTTVPTQFLVDASGEILLASPGFSRDDFLEVARRAAELSGGEPADPFPAGENVPPFRPG